MVKLEQVRRVVPTIVTKQPLVAVFFGGTSGIGSHTPRALAKHTGKTGTSIRIYIIGRKEEAAKTIIAECKDANSKGEYHFIQAVDLSLIRCVNDVCDQIVRLEEEKGADGRIDYLMLCQGGSIFLPRQDTEEGIDVTMSLMYYSRMRAITRLMPLLLKSSFPPIVVSVYASGMEAKLFPDDLSLRDLSHFSYSQARSHMCYMHTLFMERLVEQNPGKVRMIHIFPGLVLGPQFFDPKLPAWFRFVWGWFFVPIFGPFTVKPWNNADRMLYLACERYPPKSEEGAAGSDAIVGTGGKPGTGVYNLTWNCEGNYQAKRYVKMNKQEMRDKVWQHTMDAFDTIEKGDVFTK